MSAPRLDAVIWHGQQLDVVLSGNAEPTRVTVHLDRLYFSEVQLPAGGGTACFNFPFSPNGHDALAISLRLEPSGHELLSDTWHVCYGVAARYPHDPATQTLAKTGPNALPELAPLFGAMIYSPLAQPHATTVPVSIIVPIFNAPQLVARCIDSVLKYSQGLAQLILIDDASTDISMTPLLARYANSPNITLLRNPRNLGYTHTIALGLQHATDGDVVMLNADAEVGPNWLLGLRRAAYTRADIGTVTAVSDNAGAFSVPELEHYNPLPPKWSAPQTTRALWQNAGLVTPALPSGNGFCMYVKRAMLERVGGPDVDAFPQGYGEENDWCQRAEQAGFVHVIAGNVLVRHARSASFGDARRESLGYAGMAVLRQRYPLYEAAVGASLFSFERRVLDWRVRHIYRTALSAVAPPRPRVLWIAGSDTLGTNETLTLNLLTQNYEPWQLTRGEHFLVLSRYDTDGWREQQRTQIVPCVEFAPATWLHYDEMFTRLIQHYAIELVHVFDANGHSGHMSALCRALALPLLEKHAVSSPAEASSLEVLYQAALQAELSFVVKNSTG